MPTYQYACTACDERLEVVQKFSDEPLTVCPACSSRLRKVFSPVGVVFKGSGFYRTDSRKDSGKSGGKEAAAKSGSTADGSAASKDTGSTSSTSEAKPASTSESSAAKKTSPGASKVA